MKKISVLDCTLRDGGYCNNWNFGENNITKIITGLVNANVEIIECGFLTKKTGYCNDSSKFTDLMQLNKHIPKVDTKQIYVVMINYGEYEIDELPDCKDCSIDGIRVAFHKKDIDNATEFCRRIKEKGYLLFVQPMVSMSYTDDEFCSLITRFNQISPYAFYIVDSFGMMKKKDVLHFWTLTNKFLNNEIAVGFHAHNNFQLANSNAQIIVENQGNKDIIIDVSLHGMGRGAGNLNAELFLDYVNDFLRENKYVIKPLIILDDEIISRFYKEKNWGYSLPNYLSAVHMIHPNYANYLSEKNTLTVDAMDEIFSLIDPMKALEYDPIYIKHIYDEYMLKGTANNLKMGEIQKIMEGKPILLIAPGRMAEEEKCRVIAFVREKNPIVISVNHAYPYLNVDFIFVSNMRRFKQLSVKNYSKTIITSNIVSEQTFMSVPYFDLLNTSEFVKENAGLMAIQFVINMGCCDIYLAGYDGYSYESTDNYEASDLTLIMDKMQMEKLNFGMRQVLDEFRKVVKLQFITTSLFI